MSSAASNSLKVIFLAHFLLVAWSVQGCGSPESCLFYNALFFITLLWSMHCPDAQDPVQMALCINIFCVGLDIGVIVFYFPSTDLFRGKFSLSLAIINLLLRPLSCFRLYRDYQGRAGTQNVTIMPTDGVKVFGDMFGQTNPHCLYEDMDRNRGPPPVVL